MKKTIFAVAVTAALGLTAAQAETVLYGSIRTGVDYTKNHAAYTNVDSQNRAYTLYELIQKNPEAYTNLDENVRRFLVANPERAADMRFDASGKAISPYSANQGWVQDQDVKAGYVPNTYQLKPKRKYGLNMVDTGSRIGLKGGEDLGNGIQAIFQLEWGFNGVEGYGYGNGFKNRLAYVGLTSEQFGTVVLGRLDNPFHAVAVGHSGDNMNEVYLFGTAMAATYVLTGGFSPYNGGDNTDYLAVAGAREDGGLSSRVGNALAYVSPTWSGFSFNAAVVMDSPDDSEAYGSLFGDASRGVDMYTINAKYVHESGFNAGLGFMRASRIGNRGTQGVATTDGHSYGYNDAISVFTGDGFGASQSLSVNSNLIAANVGFENDMFKVGLGFLHGKGKSENLVRTHYNYNAYDNGTVGRNGYDSWSFVKADQKATGWDLGGQYFFNEGMTSVIAQVGRMSGTSKESRVNANSETNKQFRNNFFDSNSNINNGFAFNLPGSAVNRNTGTWNDHKTTVVTWAIGFEHKLSQRTKAWIEYEGARMSNRQDVEWSTPVASGPFGETKDVWVSGQRRINERHNRVNVGIRHDF